MTGGGRVAGVIGWPVAHSLSPAIHGFWLERLGLEGAYGRFAVPPDRLGDALRGVAALGLAGVNVTAPHKVAAMEWLDRVDPLAARVGAVNCVVAGDGGLTGHNTDVAGFLEPLAGVAGTQDHYVVVGTGGAARAAAVALAGRRVTLVGRSRARAEALALELGAGEAAVLEGFRPDGAARTILVHATPAGMAGAPPLAIDLGAFGPDTIVYDLVYRPLDTPLLVAARARGMRTIDGLGMLIGQAAPAFHSFYGAAPPRGDDAELRARLLRMTGEQP